MITELIFVGSATFLSGLIVGYLIGYAKGYKRTQAEPPELPDLETTPDGKLFRVFYLKTDRARPKLIFTSPSGALARRFYEGYTLDGECCVEFYQDEQFRGRRGP